MLPTTRSGRPSPLPESWRERHREFFARVGHWSHGQLVEVAAVASELEGAAALGSLRRQLEAIGPGYHETVTGCWLELIRLAGEHGWSPEEMARRFSFSQLPFAFYSPELLNSPEAARSHLAPDLQPLALPVELAPGLADTLVAFQSRRLPKEDWSHACHLRVAAGIFLLLGKPGRHVMAIGIQRLNEAHGVPLTPSGGYHETLTRLWFHLVAEAAERTGLTREPQSGERLEQTLRELDDKTLPLRYYTRERIMSWEARIGWLEPDLQNLNIR